MTLMVQVEYTGKSGADSVQVNKTITNVRAVLCISGFDISVTYSGQVDLDRSSHQRCKQPPLCDNKHG